MSLRQVHINEDRENSSGYNFCSVTVNMKLWISCIFLIFRVANISMFTCSKSRSHPQLKKKNSKTSRGPCQGQDLSIFVNIFGGVWLYPSVMDLWIRLQEHHVSCTLPGGAFRLRPGNFCNSCAGTFQSRSSEFPAPSRASRFKHIKVQLWA